MQDRACIDFLQWCLPQLELRWPGYRKVRRLVAKRLNRRLAALGLGDLSAYRGFLIREPAEWTQLHAMCRIPISRFYRDRGVFEAIGRRLLPEAAAAAVARGDTVIRGWSAGCASGEEPYSLVMVWRFLVAQDWPTIRFTVLATDAEDTMVERARAGCYGRSSLKELPQEWIERAFIRRGALFCVAPPFREGIAFAFQDIRQSMPEGSFDLILCRNLVFTYFDVALQRRIVNQLRERLRGSGFLVIGSHEALPANVGGFALVDAKPGIYRRDA